MSTLYMVSAAYYTDQGDIPMHIYHLLEALQRSVKVSDVKQSCPHTTNNHIMHNELSHSIRYLY